MLNFFFIPDFLHPSDAQLWQLREASSASGMVDTKKCPVVKSDDPDRVERLEIEKSELEEKLRNHLQQISELELQVVETEKHESFK